jgi:hypothetical protein
VISVVSRTFVQSDPHPSGILSFVAMRLTGAPSVEFMVIEAVENADDRLWRVVLAAPGAADANVAASVVRAALAIARSVEGAGGIDLLIVDPDDATAEIRIRLRHADLDDLDLDGLDERDLLALAA